MLGYHGCANGRSGEGMAKLRIFFDPEPSVSGRRPVRGRYFWILIGQVRQYFSLGRQ
jgi:hypothetical protein